MAFEFSLSRRKKVLLTPLLLLGSASAATLPVSATTTIIGDFVRVVGGNRVSVNVIVPPGGDSHTFQPTTAAIRGLSGSRALFANGANLEPWLPKLRSAAPGVPVTELTAGLTLRAAPEDASAPDPHAWWDPTLAAGYARGAANTLTKLDPAGKGTYQNNLNAFLKQLASLDAYAKTQFASIPPARRLLVTNHDSLHYLANRYGLKVVGTVIPGLGTDREPGARELASLVGAVKASGARVIFTENTVNARLAQALAQETGARIAPPLYTDALGPKGSAGDTYLKAFKTNVDTMVRALR